MNDPNAKPDIAPTSTANGELAAMPPPANSPQAMAALYGGNQSALFCSFDPRSPAGIALLDRCEEAPDAKLREVANVRLRLVHVYGHMVDLTDSETGEVNSRLRTCLIDASGKVYACVSEGIRKSIVRLSTQHGIPPWPKGIDVVVKVRVQANGHSWLYLLNDSEAQSEKGAPKR